jgi:hypothetical protein
VKKYRNPNIPKPTPGSDTGKEPRYKKQPVKTTPPVRKKGPGGGPKAPLPPRKERGIRNPVGNKTQNPLVTRSERQLPRKGLSMISKKKPAPKNKGGR